MDLAFLAQRHVEGELRCQEWTVNGDNGADGNLAQRHVEGELRFQEGGFGITSAYQYDPANWILLSKTPVDWILLSCFVRPG